MIAVETIYRGVQAAADMGIPHRSGAASMTVPSKAGGFLEYSEKVRLACDS